MQLLDGSSKSDNVTFALRQASTTECVASRKPEFVAAVLLGARGHRQADRTLST
ncbi:hypothetical protein [Paraburkholderia sp. BL10I2N1]|uniref:hypothetical protein n=1 Tax=Paraburkholderia sp. BL10I2N1 TaxID=1938796 RepID=UPI0010CE3FE8|nr:hypothetical protein [Paraburkholderia sp. BL10I2N1]TDN62889.1 hypothetical protein B0G77_6482 [Paraburkholderia sp. BL10I2N1]